MPNQALINASQLTGLADEQVSQWREVAPLMATLEAIGRDGASAVVKIDGGRPDAIYTVVLSGPRLGESFFRKDGSDVQVLLREAIEFYVSKVPLE